MMVRSFPALYFILAWVTSGALYAEERAQVKESAFQGTDGVTVKLRMEDPYTADAPLQVVCYFRYTPEGSKKMTGAPIELDKELGGVIASLRERGEFSGDALETLLIIPPPNSIKAKSLLLIGLGDESGRSTELIARVGKAAVREAARIGASRVAFAPLIRDQGNSAIEAGDVERAITSGVLLAYNTDKRMQKEGLAKNFVLEQWIAEAGPAYFDATTVGLKQAIEDAKAEIAKRPIATYATAKQ